MRAYNCSYLQEVIDEVHIPLFLQAIRKELGVFQDHLLERVPAIINVASIARQASSGTLTVSSLASQVWDPSDFDFQHITARL